MFVHQKRGDLAIRSEKSVLKDYCGWLIHDCWSTYFNLTKVKHGIYGAHILRELQALIENDQSKWAKAMKALLLNTFLMPFQEMVKRRRTIESRFHLNKHKKDVDRFYLKVISIKFESEFALSFQKRFVKYKEKLFLFLEKDNIPWNNNNAEYSIKPFAKWRKKISKSLTKQNIENHLILLSILQTCKYQGINFFEFLRSGELSIFEFQEKRK